MSDDEIVKNKGSEPVMPFAERLAALTACKFVDEVIAGTEYELQEAWVKTLLASHAIDFIAHGDDPCITADGKDAYEYPKRINKFRMFKRTEGVSTTDLVGRMLLHSREHHIRPGDKRHMRSLRSSSLHDADPGARAVVADAAEGARPQTELGTIASDDAEPERSARPGEIAASAAAEAEPVSAPVHGAADHNISGDDDAGADCGDASVCGVSESGSDWKFMPTSRRIAQFAESRTPALSDRVVYIAGAWDLFNAGHAAALQEARKHGDFVLVGVYDDETVHRLHGTVSGAPVMNLFERALSVLACRYVDDVVMGAPLVVTQDLMRTFKVDIVLIGTASEARASCLEEEVIESAVAVPRRLHKLHQFESPMTLLSSDVIDRVLSKRDVFESRVRRKQVAEEKYREERVFMEEK